MGELPVMQRENERSQAWPLTTREKERSRLVVEGRRTDDGVARAILDGAA